jgi:hypothetical protein
MAEMFELREQIKGKLKPEWRRTKCNPARENGLRKTCAKMIWRYPDTLAAELFTL